MTNVEMEEFLKFFPEVEPPIILSSEEIILYSRENKPLPQQIIIEVLMPIHKESELDEFTEYIPCFRLKKENSFVPVVYYKAGIVKNEYHLIILSEKGKIVSHKSIAGTFIKNDEMVTYVASIDEDHHIKVVIGSNNGNKEYYNPLNSQTISYDIAPDGKIIMSNTQ